ncbi:maleylpyruvate isomerase family mycothiol-dependent enzyme [Modestobacter sp. NPDC049651]|uniref:maleylpyruvate isomerase family mycothiol-dependent enzyme n=1 Tax=unclassified Modestobacter TaxID=2643866 RepID=UPI0034020B48
MTAPTEYLDWWRHGEEHLGTALGRLTDEEFAGPSLLPGWTRAHVLAHLAGNAEAQVNFLTWARTGVETPPYASDEARDQAIAERAALPPAELRALLLDSVRLLVAAVEQLPDAAWSASVRNRQGQEIPAVELPLMRAREVWVHSVDLDAGVGFDEVPAEVLASVVDDVFTQWDARDVVPDVVVFAGDREWGTGRLAVSGSLADVAAWLTGRGDGAGLRSDGPLPSLAAWR